MAYLSYEQYKELGGVKVDENKFSLIESAAETVFDSQTRAFYWFHDIDADPEPKRAELFRRAMVLQIEFAGETGITSPTELVQARVSHVSIGRTSVDTTGDIKSLTYGNSGMCISARNVLALTGLLYKGVSSC